MTADAKKPHTSSGKLVVFVVFAIALAAALAILLFARKGPPENVKHPEDGTIIPWAGKTTDSAAPAKAP